VTVVVIFVSAYLSAWGKAVADRTFRDGIEIAANTIHYAFGAIAIGAGIQLLFRG